MVRASIELAALGFFVAVLLNWCDAGASFVELLRLGAF